MREKMRQRALCAQVKLTEAQAFTKAHFCKVSKYVSFLSGVMRLDKHLNLKHSRLQEQSRRPKHYPPDYDGDDDWNRRYAESYCPRRKCHWDIKPSTDPMHLNPGTYRHNKITGSWDKIEDVVQPKQERFPFFTPSGELQRTT